tara:strand:- start:14326 stop:15555 length:1230 start_codon:yes stop_codon:yes gene_type:complete
LISKLEKKIAFRYLKTRKSDGFLNVISIFSFIGISLGVAVLIIVMSVMNGFRTELTNKIIGFNAHILIKPYLNPIDQNLANNRYLKKISKNILLSNNGEAIIIDKDYTKGTLIRGYKENDYKKLELVNNKYFKGSKKLVSGKISIGKELAFLLDVNIGDQINIMSPVGLETIIGSLPKQDKFTISSIYESGLIEFDQNVVFMNINDLEDLFNFDESKRFIEIYLNNASKLNDYKKEIKEIFSEHYLTTWEDMNRSLLSALKIERNVMFIILSLIIIVAAFNIISGLTILVKNKTREIGILKSIGLKKESIRKIFFIVGFLIGSLATIFGVILGVLFSIYVENIRNFLSKFFNISLFPEEIYFLSKMPSEINLITIILIGTCSIFATCIVSIYPAVKASKLDPIKALKYE